MDNNQLLGSIEHAFRSQDRYFFDKHIPEFFVDNNFLGDCYIQVAVENRAEDPPRFYQTFSPFDVKSGKAPQQGLVFENGELLLDIDFTHYADVRTAAMNAVVLRAMDMTDLSDKRVLIFGAGKVAMQAALILNDTMGLSCVDVISASQNLENIRSLAYTNPLEIRDGDIRALGEYDVIMCHTNTSTELFRGDRIEEIKQGAFLSAFHMKESRGELPCEIYNCANANVIVDWEKTLLEAKDLEPALVSGALDTPIFLGELLEDSSSLDKTKHYTVYRSTGTPIQNLAVLSQLVEKSKK